MWEGAAAALAKDHEKERHEKIRQRKAVLFDTLEDATRFAEYDVDGNQALDFEEFYAMQCGARCLAPTPPPPRPPISTPVTHGA